MAIRELPMYESTVERYKLVDDVDKFVDYVLSNKPEVMAVDTETYYNPDLEGSVIRFIKGSKNNCPFGASFYWGDEGYWVNKDLHKLAPILQDKNILKVFHNSKFDLHQFLNIGVEVAQPICDTATMIHLIDEEHECELLDKDGNKYMKKSKALKNLAFHYLGGDAKELETLVSEYRKIIAENKGIHKEAVSYKDVDDANPVLMKDYAVADTEFTYKLYFIFLEEIRKQKLEKALEVDMNATLGVLAIERAGFPVDQELMNRDKDILENIILETKTAIYDLVGEFNINSSAELVDKYDKECCIKWSWKTDKDEWDTSKKILKGLISGVVDDKASRLSELVLKYRKCTKILDTYIISVQEYIQNGRIHCDYWLNAPDHGAGGTKTGRLSSSSPNLQNVPKEPIEIEEHTFNVRNYFIAEEDYSLFSIDYDAQEYRVLGHYSQDKTFMNFIKDGKDIHRATAAMIFNVAYDEVTNEQRKKGKSGNFAIVYGMGNAALANSLGHEIDGKLLRAGTSVLYKVRPAYKYPPYDKRVKFESGLIQGIIEDNPDAKEGIEYFFSDEVQAGIDEARLFKKQYFNMFPSNKDLIDSVTNVAKSRGWVKTYWGRKRHFKDPKNEAYKACNALIQGTCGDILKVKLYELMNYLHPYKSYIANNVHDQIDFMIHKDELFLVEEVRKIMEDLPFRVPITCGCETGPRWGSLEDYKN